MFQLVDQGKLTLDTPAAELLPELADIVVLDGATTRPAKNPILIRHLLNQTSGLFYTSSGLTSTPFGLGLPYITRYSKEDPVGEFFRILKVSGFWRLYLDPQHILCAGNLSWHPPQS